MSDLRFGIVGATGAVGREMLSVLEERAVPCKSVRLFASERSFGEAIEFREKELAVEILNSEAMKELDIVLFSAGGDIAREFAPVAADAGAIVIDNSSAFRMDPKVPLVVPEVNADELRAVVRDRAGKGVLIANPNCSTIQLCIALAPLDRVVGLKRVIVSTYQSVSGAGQKGIEELSAQVTALFGNRTMEVTHFPHQIAFNCIPQIDSFGENGFTREEMKIVNETRKILNRADLKITSTAVRVPTFSCHAESVNVDLNAPLSVNEARELFAQSPGVIVTDSPAEKAYPMNTEVVGTDATYVGRIRQDLSSDSGLQFWVVADNLRKGAALNAVQIAEIVMQERV